MKPVIIYTLHRTKATASMTACKRSIMNTQSFVFENPHSITKEQWLEKTKYVDDPNSVTRVRGRDIGACDYNEEWYFNKLNKENYDIFVIEREDRLATMLSFFTSKFFGFNKFEEIDPYPVEVSDNIIDEVEFNIQSHIKYYPNTGTVVTFETLPESHFDKHLITHAEQHSKEKFKYLTNLDYCIERCNNILLKYNDEWDEKIKSLKNSLF